MTRIIAGFAGSTRLQVPRAGTRPTSDRVREAIFSALAARDEIHGARVVDLYAGSGSLGLEAASRGAAVVALVENNAAASRVCRTNTELVLARAGANPPTVTVKSQTVQGFLSTASAPIDLVFLDPPYDLTDTALGEDLRALVPLLSEDAVVMVERGSRSPEPDWPAGLVRERRSSYGDTILWWARPETEPEGEPEAQPTTPSQP